MTTDWLLVAYMGYTYDYLMVSRMTDGLTDIRTNVSLAAQLPWTMGYKIVIVHGPGLLPEYNYSVLACLGLILYSGYRPSPWAISTTYK